MGRSVEAFALHLNKAAAMRRYEEGCSLQYAFTQLHKNLQRQNASQETCNKAILAASCMVVNCVLQVTL